MWIVVALAAAATVACLSAAVAEAWRFSLLLAGRTRVLDGGPVHASDVTVAIAGTAALVLGAVTAVASLPLLVTLHRASAERAGHAPARNGADLLARLVVPGWNLYGAGQVLMEIARALSESDTKRRSSRITLPLWWVAWVANGALVTATLIMAFGRSNQIVADTVEMHIGVDIAAAAVAGLFAAVIASMARSWAGRGTARYDGWAVRQPDTTARNRVRAEPTAEVSVATGAGVPAGTRDGTQGEVGAEVPADVRDGESAGLDVDRS